MPSKYLRSLSKLDKQKFIDSFDTVITDCDGVIWTWDTPIENAVKTFNRLVECGKRVFYITNNSTKTRNQYYEKFMKHGFNVPANHIFNTATLAAKYVRSVLPAGKSVYVVGPDSLVSELAECNITSFGPGRDELSDKFWENISHETIELRDNVGAVVVGFDQFISYPKMMKAVTYLKDKNCIFVCTNTDETFPSLTSFVLPGTGSVVAGIRTACGRKPFVIGKPSTYVVDVLLEEHQINPDRTLFIGDRCNTDILMGNKCSFQTLLVLTGVHSIDDVKKFAASSDNDDKLSVPQYYTDSVADLCES